MTLGYILFSERPKFVYEKKYIVRNAMISIDYDTNDKQYAGLPNDPDEEVGDSDSPQMTSGPPPYK